MKLRKLISVFVVTLALTLTFNSSTDASTKIMWGKTELKAGQIGKVTVLSKTVLFKIEGTSIEPIRTLNPGEEYRVYSAKIPLDGYVPMYGLGGGYYIVQNNTMLNGITVKYETPSKAKLALLNKK